MKMKSHLANASNEINAFCILSENNIVYLANDANQVNESTSCLSNSYGNRLSPILDGTESSYR
jgi:hypothetical protein